MSARFDHLVVAVADLDEAAARWNEQGLVATRGGAHPVGTENVLVRGPRSAYVELIAPGSDESNPWLDRVRSSRGPISWAIAVDDIAESHAALVAAGFDPRPVTEGSRTTREGDVVGWRMCDVGPGPYDGSLPFLIQWTTPMAPGPADGPILEWVSLTPPDPDRLADLLVALGFVPSRHWPRRVFHQADGMGITLAPVGEPEDLGTASWSMSWGDPAEEPPVSITLGVPGGELTHFTLDGVAVTTHPDRRRFPGAALLPAVDEVGEAGLDARADAWVAAIRAAGLGVVEPVGGPSVRWAQQGNVETTRAVRVRGSVGTQPLTVAWGSHPALDETVVVVGVGDPVEVLERQPELPWSEPSYERGLIDDAFVLALSGGVYVVREGTKVVRRS